MSGIPAFGDVYDKDIGPAMQELEKTRLPLRRLGLMPYVFGFSGVGFFVWLSARKDHPVVLFLLTLICIGIAGWLYRVYLDRKKKYVAAFKIKVIRTIVSAINPELVYLPESKIPESDYDLSNLYTEGYDIYRGEDFVGGTIGVTRFGFSELNVLRRMRRTADSEMAVIFHGLFFAADFNKYFNGRTYVWDHDKPGFTVLNKSIFDFAEDLDKVLLEDPEFMDQFVVFSNDQMEARYILSPSLMRRMMKLVYAFGGDISFSFVGTSIYLGIPFKKDLFEPAIMRKPRVEKIAWYYDLLVALTGIVEELNLNQRIWTKR